MQSWPGTLWVHHRNSFLMTYCFSMLRSVVVLRFSCHSPSGHQPNAGERIQHHESCGGGNAASQLRRSAPSGAHSGEWHPPPPVQSLPLPCAAFIWRTGEHRPLRAAGRRAWWDVCNARATSFIDVMSDVPPSRNELPCLICGERGRFNVGSLRRHQLMRHRGAVLPPPVHAAPRAPNASPNHVCAPAHVVAGHAPGQGDGSGGAAGAGGDDGKHDTDGADGDLAVLLESTRQSAPPVEGRGTTRRRPGEPAGGAEEVTYPSVATRVCAVYEGYGDAARAVPLAQRAKSSKAGRFNDSRLRLFQSFVLNAEGCGLSGGDIDDIWHLFHEWEPKKPAKEGEPPRLRDIFTSAHALKQARSHDIDEALLSEDWMACSMTELGEAYEAYFRPALGVLLEAMNAPKVRYWARGSEKEGPSECRETPFDGDAFRLCQEDVIREHGDAAFVLGIHVFSDSCALTSSGGK